MHEDSRTIKSIDWRAVFPSLNLFRAFSISIQPGKLLLGLALILVIYISGRTMDAAWGWARPEKQYDLVDPNPFSLPTDFRSPYFNVNGPTSGPFDVFMKWELAQLNDISERAWALDFRAILRPLHQFVIDGPYWLLSRHPIFALILGAISLLAWAIFGGAIARMSAIQLARDAKISTGNALRFSTGKVLSFVSAPLILALFIGGLGLAIALVNLIFLIPLAGPVIVGVAFILTLVVAFVLALATLGSLFGFSLLYPTVAVEGTDAFDAISRSFGYFVHRPGKTLAYLFVSLVYGAICYYIVKFCVAEAIQMLRWFQMSLLPAEHARWFDVFFPGPNQLQLSYSVSYPSMQDEAHKAKFAGMRAGAMILSFWYFLVVGLVGAYVVSFYFSISTIIYSLLRLDIDATELDDVYLEDADDEELLDAPPAPEPPPSPVSSPAAAIVPGVDPKPEEEAGEQPSTWSASPPLP